MFVTEGGVEIRGASKSALSKVQIRLLADFMGLHWGRGYDCASQHLKGHPETREYPSRTVTAPTVRRKRCFAE